MSEYRGRGSRSRGTRGRGGPFRGGPRRGGYDSERDSSRGGFSRGRGDGFSRGRGGPPRHLSRDDSPPRKVPLMSRGYDSERGRGPPMDRRMDRYEDGYERGIPTRSRDLYSSSPRDSGRLMDRSSPPLRGSYQDRDDGDYPSSRGEFLSPRSYSSNRESGSYRDSYGSSMRDLREDRRESFTRPSPREYPSQRTALEYSERSREFREPPREYGSSREFREPLSARGEFRDREYREIRVSSRDYGGRGSLRGLRGGRDEQGSIRGTRVYLNGSRGRGGPPRGRGRPEFRGGRRSTPPSRDGPIGKRPRLDGGDGYSRR